MAGRSWPVPSLPRSTSWKSNSCSSAFEKTSSAWAVLSWAVCSAAMSAIGGDGGTFRASTVLAR